MDVHLLNVVLFCLSISSWSYSFIWPRVILVDIIVIVIIIIIIIIKEHILK